MYERLPPPHPDEPVGAYAHRMAIALRTSDLLRHYSRAQLRHALGCGHLIRVLPGIVAASLHASSFAVRSQAIVMWSDAPLSEVAALFAWGLIDTPPAALTTTTACTRNPRPRPGYRVRRVVRPPEETTRRGLRIVTPAEAVAAGYGRIDARDRAEVVFRAVRERLVTPRQLRSVLDASPRVPARTSLERRVAAAERGAHSALEEVARRSVFAGDEFAEFERQHEVVIEGNRFVLDMFSRHARLAVELDGARYHATVDAWQHDINRDAWLAMVGISTVRLSYQDLQLRPEWCRRVVRGALRYRVAGR